MSQPYAQVLVFLPLRARTSPLFDYAVPQEMRGTLRPGMLVMVPFKRQRLPGLVMSRSAAPSVPRTRPIHSMLDPEPVLTAPLLYLARWMARETLASLYECVKIMLPPGMRPRTTLLLKPLVSSLPKGVTGDAETLLALLIARGPLKSGQVSTALKGVRWRPAMEKLRARKLITVERLQQLPGMRPKTVKMVTLLAPPESWEEGLSGLQKLALYRSVLEFLEQEGQSVEASVVYAETGAQAGHLKMLHKRRLIALNSEEMIRDPLADYISMPADAPTLIPDQRAVWEKMLPLLEPRDAPPAPVLLLGVTGSGKTEIYLRATEKVLSQGRQALVLVPEISLTPQTVRRFVLRFPGKVGVWHSGMSDGERYDTWRRVRNGELAILVGARSALFAPFSDLGLIVLDEEEDASYKGGCRPYYHARETAEALAQQTGALLVLGSATPSLESYARALAGRYHLLEMPRRVLGHRQRIADWQQHLHIDGGRYRPLPEAPQACTISLPPVQVVDLREELKAGNRAIFSRALQQAVDRALDLGQQVILFLNRRGTATHVFCRDCGWVATCPKCAIPLTYHAHPDLLVCHHCGYRMEMVRACPDCGSTRVRAFGLGTERLAQQVADRWPQARLLRWDRDVARSHVAHTSLLTGFAAGDADILVGTQMVARGLDFPGVTVVGIISADVGMHLPDFRAAERTFQLLTQVAGRAGRGLLGGRVILQTYHPDHYAVQHAAVHDYAGFAGRELAFRQQAGYPPALRMARLVFRHTRASKARAAAESLAGTLREALAAAEHSPADLIGPAPAFFARVRGYARWQILLRSVDPAAFLRTVTIPPGWLVDIDPVDVL